MKLLIYSVILTLYTVSISSAQTSLCKSVLSSGGEDLSNSEFVVRGTVGQTFIGVTQNSVHENLIGFWYPFPDRMTTSVDDYGYDLAADFRLGQNYPNPFNQRTEIPFDLAKASDVGLQIFNVQGQLIRTFSQVDFSEGAHNVQWDGRDGNGLIVPNGLYFYRFRVGRLKQVKKMTFMR